MSDPAQLLVDHLDIWTGAIEHKSGSGRGNGGKISLYGIDKLRSLILDLAVRGKLVPQDPAEGDARDLLNLIRAARAEPRKPIVDQSSEGPFALPSAWLWCRLSEVVDLENGDRGKNYPNKSTLVDEGVPFVNAGHLQNGLIDEDQMTFITRSHYERLSGGKFREGDILFCLRGSLGKSAIVRGIREGAIASSLVIVRNHGRFDNEYLRVFFDSPLSELLIRKFDNGTAQPNLSSKSLGKFDFPLPPLGEQKRIVAKVDELMALVDALEVGTRAGMAAHETLVRELLATLVNSQDAEDLALNWSRIEAHFDTLFTTEGSIDALKQTVLELAVRGKLVERDPGDEPAEKMLAAAKRLVAKGAKVKDHPKVNPKDQPFPLPRNWFWERFDNLIEPEAPIAYGVLVPGDDQPDGVPFVRIADLSITNPPELPEKAISPAVDAQYQRTRIKGGEVLMGVVGSIGKLGVAPDSWAGANIARAICRIVPASFMDKRYVLWLLQSKFMQDSFKGDTRTLAQPTLNLTLIRLAATPIPPLAEQHRIVAKLDQLMALCDALEARLAGVAQTQCRLAVAINEQAV